MSPVSTSTTRSLEMYPSFNRWKTDVVSKFRFLPCRAVDGKCQTFKSVCTQESRGTDHNNFFTVVPKPDISFPTNNMRSKRAHMTCHSAAGTFDQFLPNPQPAFLREQSHSTKEKSLIKLLSMERRQRKEMDVSIRQEQDSSGADAADKADWPMWRFKGEETQRESRRLTRRVLNLGKRRQLDQMFDTIEEAKRSGTCVNVITMNAALTACVNCGEIDRALEAYEGMVSHGGVGADTITYGVLLKGLGQACRVDDAFEIIEALEKGTAPGSPPLTEVHINTLINACAEAGEALRARGVLSRFRGFSQSGGSAVFTYNLLIKGYARSDNPLEALRVLQEMKLLGLSLEKVTYNSLILACVRGNDLDSALDLLEEMKSEARRLHNLHLLPDVVTYTTLLKGFAQDGDLEGVRQLAQEMKRSPTCVMDRVAYTAMVDAAISAGSAEEGLRFMAEMEAEAESNPQLRPRPHVFLAVMRALAERGDLARTRQVADRMVQKASGHVWPEDRIEMMELVMEAAMNAGEVKEAKKALSSIIAASKGGQLSFTARGNKALVQLMVATEFADCSFQPITFKKKISPWSTVDSVMIRFEDAKPLQPSQTIAEVAGRFSIESALPVCDANGRCVGMLFEKDCQKLTGLVEDAMQPPPPKIHESSLVSYATECLKKSGAEFLTVVKEDVEFYMSKRGFKSKGGPGDGLRDDAAIGFIGLKQLFDF